MNLTIPFKEKWVHCYSKFSFRTFEYKFFPIQFRSFEKLYLPSTHSHQLNLKFDLWIISEQADLHILVISIIRTLIKYRPEFSKHSSRRTLPPLSLSTTGKSWKNWLIIHLNQSLRPLWAKWMCGIHLSCCHYLILSHSLFSVEQDNFHCWRIWFFRWGCPDHELGRRERAKESTKWVVNLMSGFF